jgi:hypothetical protein
MKRIFLLALAAVLCLASQSVTAEPPDLIRMAVG